MPYTIYQTDAYVLKSQPQGEANKRIDLLTKDFGVVRGTAQGVRYLKSKLRYTLTDFSRISVSLVRGKEIWRIVNAFKYEDMFFDLPYDIRMIFLRVFSLLGRLITGELSEPHIYELIRSAHSFVDRISTRKEELSIEEQSGLEYLLMIQLLNYLGYIPEDSIINKYEELEWTRGLLMQAYCEKKEMIKIINHALGHTGL